MRCSHLKEVDIPKGVEFIDDRAFCFCRSLEDVKISGKLQYIGTSAFGACLNLKPVEVTNNVKLGKGAFPWFEEGEDT